MSSDHAHHNSHRYMYVVALFGGRTGTRTLDPLIKSQLLYRLSYAPSCELTIRPASGVGNWDELGAERRPRFHLRTLGYPIDVESWSYSRARRCPVTWQLQRRCPSRVIGEFPSTSDYRILLCRCPPPVGPCVVEPRRRSSCWGWPGVRGPRQVEVRRGTGGRRARHRATSGQEIIPASLLVVASRLVAEQFVDSTGTLITSAKRAQELQDVMGQSVGLLHGREVAAFFHGRPLADVGVSPAGQQSRWP